MDREKAQRVVVVLNGQLEDSLRLRELLDEADLIIAADGGGSQLAALGYTPSLVVGDMDSIDPKVLHQLEQSGARIERHPAEKDETDAELALAAAAKGAPDEIIVLGALGGRIDHALANLSLLTMPELAGTPTRIEDRRSSIRLVARSARIRGEPGAIISLIPWGGDAQGVRTRGLKYKLRGETLPFGPSRGVSNVLMDREAAVSLESGHLLLIQTELEKVEASDG